MRFTVCQADLEYAAIRMLAHPYNLAGYFGCVAPLELVSADADLLTSVAERQSRDGCGGDGDGKCSELDGWIVNPSGGLVKLACRRLDRRVRSTPCVIVARIL